MNDQAHGSGRSRAIKCSAAFWISALLILGVFAIYWPVFGYGFVAYDDPLYVSQNPQVMAGLSWPGFIWAFSTFSASNWHPLTWLSYMSDTQFWGMRAGAYHTTNIVLHATNTVLLFLLLKRLTGAIWQSAFVAALFGFHPLHVESVAWISERKDVLSTLFFMLTLSAYARYTEFEVRKRSISNRKWIWYGLALVLFALGLMSKPMLVTLPFVLLLLDFWPLRRFAFSSPNSSQRQEDSAAVTFLRLIVEKTPFLALSAAACVITILAQSRGGAMTSLTAIPLAERVENAVISYWFYLVKAVWPANLAVFYPYSPITLETTVMAALALLLISGAVFRWWQKKPYLVTGWLWFLGTLIPVIGLVQVGMQAMADRYTYVPLIGFFLAITWGASEIQPGWRPRRYATAVASVVVLGTCLVLTTGQVHWWRNSESLARRALGVTADNSTMEIILGNALLEQQQPEAAAEHFSEAARLDPTSAPTYANLALALTEQGKFDDAVVAYRTALRLNPHRPRPHDMLGNLLASQGDYEAAIEQYKAALLDEPDYVFVLNDFAWLLATAPDSRFRNGSEAVSFAERACRLTSYRIAQFVGTLAAAYAEDGRFDDAVATAQQAISLAEAQGNKTLVEKNQELLDLYRARKAYHELVGSKTAR